MAAATGYNLPNGENVKERQGLYFIPLDLTKADRAALAAAYGKP